MARNFRNFLAWFNSPFANALWKCLALISLLLSAYVWVQLYNLNRCQASYNEASNASQQARAAAAESDRQALDLLLQIVADHPRNSIPAIRTYNYQRKAGDAQRAAHPVPAPPSETCG